MGAIRLRVGDFGTFGKWGVFDNLVNGLFYFFFYFFKFLILLYFFLGICGTGGRGLTGTVTRKYRVPDLRFNPNVPIILKNPRSPGALLDLENYCSRDLRSYQ